jgi:hypothetical protein
MTPEALTASRGEAGMKGKTPEEAEKSCEVLKARALFAGQVDGSTEVNAARYGESFELLDAERPDVVFTHGRSIRTATTG